MTQRLQGKVALITGASSGIGRAVCKLFAAEGASVAAVARRVAESDALVAEIQAAGGRAVFFRGDVSIAKDCAAMVERAGLEFGRLDIAFNNAGIGSAGKFVADESEEDFDRVMDGGFVIQRVRSGAELAMSVGSADAMKVFSLIGSTRKLPGRVTGNRRRVADDSLGTKRKRRRTIGGSIVFTRDNPSFSVKPEMHSLPDVRPPLR